jgi:hypothetical protein
MRQENLAVAALPSALDVGANVGAGAVAVQHAAQEGKIWLDVLALQRLLLEAQQLPRGFVGQQHASGGIESQNRQRAGLDQHADLELRFLPKPDLLLAFHQMLGEQPPAPIQFRDEEPGHGEPGHRDRQPSERPRHPPERIAGMPEQRPDRHWGPL